MTDSFCNSSSHSQFTRRHLDLLGESSTESPLRVVALVDYDAFYAQCETVRLGLQPTEPLAVRQWNAVIAINYPAREHGIKRGMSVEDVRRLCPSLTLQHVATWREGHPTWAYRPDVIDHLTTDKAALDPYRIESRKTLKLVKDLLPSHPTQRIEKASVDEFFVDLSSQVHDILLQRFPELSGRETDPDARLPMPELSSQPQWSPDELISNVSPVDDTEPLDWDEIALDIGAEIVRNIRKHIKQEMRYTTSAGISHNKVLAKLASGYRKPNRQTTVRRRDVGPFLASYKATKILGLGGKLGAKLVETLGSDSIRDLLQVSHKDMISNLGSVQGDWVFNVIRGHETSPVVRRTIVQSMLSAKTFTPFLQNIEQAERWLRIFAADLKGRLDGINAELDRPRRPKTIAVHHHIRGRFGPTRNKQMTISPHTPINQDTLFALSMALLKKMDREEPSWPCMGISVSIGNFSENAHQGKSIASFFEAGKTRKRPSVELQSGQTKVRKLYGLEGGGHLCEHDFEDPDEEDSTEGRNITPDKASEGQDLSPGEKASLYTCPKCNSLVAEQDVLEHLDWHVALALQNPSQQSE
ncbi:related to DNA polymerase eta [Fusarium torulosum]|uniref:DNA polymerase eta n=1 Tax=Fusarium torulosum TaxID=33205 RepID=A0AAE8MGT7_9HYPO|nr:related to DNA polymerase eta [Fusarium torulosum]